VAIPVEHGELSMQEVSLTTLEVKWTSWEDYSFKHKLRIENWDDTMAGRGVWLKKGFKMTKFTIGDACRIVPAMEQRHGIPHATAGGKKQVKDSDNDEDDSSRAKDSGDEGSDDQRSSDAIPNATKCKGTEAKLKDANEEDALRIVPWTEGKI
jgi:hypothetical protein